MQDQSDRAAALLLGTLIALTVIGSSAVAVAIPVVRAEFDVSVSDAAWIFSVFSLCFAVSTAAFGRLADLVGLRSPLIVGISLMAAGSALVGLAPSYGVLLGGRVVQGIGAGAVPVLINGVVAARWSGAARTHIFGSLLAVVAVVSGSGPIIGGAVEALLGWRWVFALPALGVLLIRPIARQAPDDRHGGTFDVAGMIAVSVLVAGLLTVLQAPTAGRTAAVVGAVLLVIGVVATTAVSARRPRGFLPHRVIADIDVVRAALAACALLASYFALLLAAPEILVTDRGWTPLQVGVALLPAAAAGAVASQLAGRLGPRYGRFPTATGISIVAFACMLVTAVAADDTVAIVIGVAGGSIGFGASQAVLVDHVTIAVPEDVTGAALGVFNLITFLGGSIGPAVVGGMSGVVGPTVALATVAIGPLAAAALLVHGPRTAMVPEAS